MMLEWIWQTRLSVRPSTSPISRMVWPTERFRHPPSACASLLSEEETAAEAAKYGENGGMLN